MRTPLHAPRGEASQTLDMWMRTHCSQTGLPRSTAEGDVMAPVSAPAPAPIAAPASGAPTIAPITAPPAAPIPAPESPRSPTVLPQPASTIAEATTTTGSAKRVFIVSHPSLVMSELDDGRKDGRGLW